MDHTKTYGITGDSIDDEVLMTEEEAAAVLAKFGQMFPNIADWMIHSGTPYIVVPGGLVHPRTALMLDIEAFEKWQQTPDEDEALAAIHVALLLSKENRIVPPVVP